MKTIQMMYEHLHWANQRILETLQTIEGDIHEEIRLFCHVLLAEKVWFTRLRGLDSSHLPIWIEGDLAVCAKLVKENKERITTFISNLTNADLDQVIHYTNSKGAAFANSIREILTHAALHGQYHRGQINAKLRINQFEPVQIDFITFVR